MLQDRIEVPILPGKGAAIGEAQQQAEPQVQPSEQVTVLLQNMERIQDALLHQLPLQSQQRQRRALQTEHGSASVPDSEPPNTCKDMAPCTLEPKIEAMQEQMDRIEALLLRHLPCSPRGWMGASLTHSVTGSGEKPEGDVRSQPTSLGPEKSKRSAPKRASSIFADPILEVDFELAKGWRAGPEESGNNDEGKSCWEDKGSCCGQVILGYVSALIVLLNSVFIGVQVDQNMRHADTGTDVPDWLQVVDWVFSLLLIVEITVRIAVERGSFIAGKNRLWNVCDVIFVISSAIDTALTLADLSFVRALRIFRVIRAARLIRTVGVIRDLRLMVASIVCSMISVFWALVLLFFCVFIFAVSIMQGVQVHIESVGRQRADDELFEYYGSVPQSVVTLFAAISGGADWTDLVGPLVEISWFFNVVYILYISFVLFGIMNILTAIFVERASEISNFDADLAIQDEIARTNSTINEMKSLFRRADLNKDGLIHSKELDAHLRDERVLAHLKILGIEVSEARGLFGLLDVEDRGHVGISEFVSGMMRLKGQAKGVDTAALLYENKRIFARLAAFMRFVEDRFEEVEMAVVPGFGGLNKESMKNYEQEELVKIRTEKLE